LQRREFLRLLALAAAAGATLSSRTSAAQAAAELYELPPFGNLSLLHLTDVHAQLLPVHFREPSVNLGNGEPPHVVGQAFLRKFDIPEGGALAHAFTHLEFEKLARRYGKVGGYAHLATLVKRLRASRPHALVLDGGDSWQGSATALWTRGADMIGAQKRLGVDFMTGHWEFTYGEERVRQAADHELGFEFLAHNVKTADFEDPVFKPYSLRAVNGVPVAVIGQAFPYTPIANPRHMVPNWSFGIQEARLQSLADEVRAKGARAVVLLSHNGMDVDLKLAARVRGIDAILGGHTHDAVPSPVRVGRTLVTNAGSNGKFLGVLDLEVGSGGVTGYRYRLLPVFSNLLEADRDMAAHIESAR
jgi:sulfur-oxidizing protein SoxB